LQLVQTLERIGNTNRTSLSGKAAVVTGATCAMRGMTESANAAHTRISCRDVEDRVNALLHDAWRKLNADRAALCFYRSIFDRTGEEGFYSDPDRVSGSGEQPTWSPNEAYIQAHERMWQPVAEFLASVGLQLDAPFRELFYSSREYKDTLSDHRRVFFGQFCDVQGTPVTAFMLTVPHSHDEFRFLVPMRIAISQRSLGRK
jgi:hypothetical protein